MEMWFSELHTSNVKLSMRIEEQLCSVESDCQRIDVLVSDEFGKFLALDGEIQSLLVHPVVGTPLHECRQAV